jgi:PAS domain S-box-containing protein
MTRRIQRPEAEELSDRDLNAAILDTAGALVVVLDRQGNVVRFNRACERVTGYRFEEVAGEPLWKRMLLPEEADAVRATFRALVGGNFPNMHENHWVARDGSRRLIAWSNTALLDRRGEVHHVIGTGIDVTERRRAEEELRRQAARLQALADASRAFASGLDYRATLDTVTRRLGELIGDCCLIRIVSEDGLMLEPVAFYHRDRQRAEFIRAVQTASPQRADEGLTGRVLRTGETILVPALTDERIRLDMKPEYRAYLEGVSSVLIAPLRARGRVFGHVTLLRDAPGAPYTVEDRAFLEDLALRAAESIENARLYGLAQASLQARDEFLSIASHELRTPLTALKLAVQNLRRIATSGGATEAVRRTIEAADRQSVRMEKLVYALLDVSRIQAGRLELSVEELDLAELVAESLVQFEDQMAEAGCTVTYQVSGPVVGHWDRLRVSQVVTNLLSNALKYGAGKPIDVRLAADEAWARLSVTDHGIGLSSDQRDRIFQRFERASSRNYGGLGLGLYIARRLVEAHGGAVHVESVPGEGATFVIELPLAGPAPAAG